jgi:glucokinase
MTDWPANELSLVADVGGTNTRCALARGEAVLTDTIAKFPNADYPGLETVLKTYIDSQGGVDCRGAAVAVAGPVRDGRGSLTNRDWTFDKASVARATGAETVAVLNDLQAQGHAVGRVAPENLTTLVEGPEAGPHAAKLVIGAGTGFNAAPVFDTETGRYVPPSEAGHANMPIRTEEELRLCAFVETAHGFPAIEDVLSGRGLERIYSWLATEDGEPTEMKSTEIMSAAADGSDPRARKAIAVYVRILGTVAGNLALVYLPFGGIYLIGGMARAMTPYYAEFGFADALRDKGRFSGFMRNFPVHLIEDDFAALNGLAAHLVDLY